MFRRKTNDAKTLALENGEDIIIARETKLKEIIGTLVYSIKVFTEDNAGLDSDVFKAQLDECLMRLEKASTPDELEEIENTLKQLIFKHQEEVTIYSVNKMKEFRSLVETLVEGLSVFTADTDLFTSEINQTLVNIEEVGVLDEIVEIRRRLSSEVSRAKQVVQEKQLRDDERKDELAEKVESLNQRLVAAQEEMLIDELTQVFNKKAFDKRIQEEIGRNKTMNAPFSLLMFDIDHFKNVNDIHGHQIGDRLLNKIGDIAKNVFRRDDYIARWGGDEFAGILYDTVGDKAKIAAERFRRRVEKTDFKYARRGAEQSVRITVSIGLAWYRDGDTPKTLVERADQALYLGKRNGRNQTRTEDEISPEDIEHHLVARYEESQEN